MAPADFFLFPKLKLPLRGTRFQSIEDIKENSRRELKSIPENAFRKCFDVWIIRWHTRSVRKVSGLPLYLCAGVILRHRAGGILQSNPHLIE